MKSSGIKAAVLCLMAVLCFCACTPGTPDSTPAPSTNTQPTQQPTETVTVTPTTETTQSAYPFPDWSFAFDQERDNMEYTYDLEDYFVPFWKRNIIKNECLCFVKEGDVIQAKILMWPEKILCVRDWSLKKEYVEGKDYLYDSETNTLRWVEGSSVPYFTQK